jgi:hypothetical protein
MDGLYIAAAFMAVYLAVAITIWAVTTKAPWRAIRDTALFGTYGIAAGVAFFVFAAWVQNTVVIATSLIGLCFVSYFVAEALNQV